MFLILANANIIETRVGSYHHRPETETIQRQLVVNNMKMQISNNPTMPVKRVFDVVREFRVGAVNNRVPPPEMPVVNSCCSTLDRTQAANVPPVYHRVHDVQIVDEWSRTWEGNSYLLHHDPNQGVTVFTTDADLRLLQRCQGIYVDGTFKSTPHPHTQFSTIHGEGASRKYVRSNSYHFFDHPPPPLVCGSTRLT